MRRPIGRSLGRERPSDMDVVKLQSRPRTLQYSLFPPLLPRNHKLNFCLFVSVAAVAAVLAVIVFLLANFYGYSYKQGYGIVIDGGSTGTRLHVFSFLNNTGKVMLNLNKGSASKKVNPGLSSFSDNPAGAGMSLYELLEFAKSKIPRDHWGETEIRLMATAGLRRLGVGIQESVLESCRMALRSSGFRFKDSWASVITGADEGIYAWIAANYALGTLGSEPHLTTGIIELGGASAQITFIPNEPFPQEFSRTIKIGGLTYNLYSHSLLDYGQNVAYESVRQSILNGIKLSEVFTSKEDIIDPCTPKGYRVNVPQAKVFNRFSDDTGVIKGFQANGNFSECRSAVLLMLQKDKEKCMYQHCHIGASYIPKLHGKFVATENFFYTSKFLGLPPTAFLSDLIMAGQKFCEEDWIKLKSKYKALQDEELIPYCFSSAYIIALLHDSLGIALNDDRIKFADQVKGVPLDWALGAFLSQNAARLEISDHYNILGTITDESSAALLFFVVSILLLIAWSISKWRQPHLKTIYDLEKGKYIVTRINR